MKQFFENIKSLDTDDWTRIGFVLGLILIIVSKPVSYLYYDFATCLYLVGLFIFISAIYVSSTTD